jgi:hypothetical protein
MVCLGNVCINTPYKGAKDDDDDDDDDNNNNNNNNNTVKLRQDRQCTYDVTIRRLRATTVAMEKQ